MKAVVVANRKGGSGKSTVISNVAVRAAAAGYRVALIDVDPQGSMASWGRSRALPTPLVVSSTPDDLDEDLEGLRSAGYDLVFIDTPGAIGHPVASALANCDLAIIPTQPTRLDLEASLETARALHRLGKPFRYVLTRCPLSQQRISEARSVLEPLGGLAGQPIGSRLDYQDAEAKGLGVTEYNRWGRAAAEVDALWLWLEEALFMEAADGARSAR